MGFCGGVFTATEAGAIAALYVLALGTLIYRTLASDSGVEVAGHRCTWNRHRPGDSGRIVNLRLACRGPEDRAADRQACLRDLARTVGRAAADQSGTFSSPDSSLIPWPSLIILVPIFLPLAGAIGLDLVHFGLIVVFNLMIGLCTPPVGYLIFLTANLAQVPAMRVIRESVPFVAVLVAVLIVVTYVPAVSLSIPNLMMRSFGIREATFDPAAKRRREFVGGAPGRPAAGGPACALSD